MLGREGRTLLATLATLASLRRIAPPPGASGAFTSLAGGHESGTDSDEEDGRPCAEGTPVSGAPEHSERGGEGGGGGGRRPPEGESDGGSSRRGGGGGGGGGEDTSEARTAAAFADGALRLAMGMRRRARTMRPGSL